MFKIVKDNKVIATTEKVVYIKKHPFENCYTIATEADAEGVAIQSLSEVYALMGKELNGLEHVIVVESDGGTDIEYTRWVSSVVFVAEAQKEDSAFDEITILEHSDLFPLWDENWTGKRGLIVRCEGDLYKSIHDVGVGQNTKPSETPSMWTKMGNPADEYPEWSQPLGSHDAYSLGAKVAHNGKKWVSNADSNIWKPGVYGWTEVI